MRTRLRCLVTLLALTAILLSGTALPVGAQEKSASTFPEEFAMDPAEPLGAQPLQMREPQQAEPSLDANGVAFAFPSPGFVAYTYSNPAGHGGIDIWSNDPAQLPPGNEVRMAYPGKVVGIYRSTNAGPGYALGWDEVESGDSEQIKKDAAIVVVKHSHLGIPKLPDVFYTYYLHMAKDAKDYTPGKAGVGQETYIDRKVWDYRDRAEDLPAGTYLGRQGNLRLAGAEVTHLHFGIYADPDSMGKPLYDPLLLFLPEVDQPGYLQIGMLYGSDTQIISGNIDPWSRQYSVYFYAEQGRVATIRMTRQDGTLHPNVELWAPDGTQIAADNDGNNDGTALIENQVLATSGLYKIVTKSHGYTTGKFSLDLHFATPGRLRVVRDLQLSTTNPQVGDIVHATFTVRNDGQQPITLQRVLAAVRGPECADWSCPRLADFPTVESITLGPLEEYTYTQDHIFDLAGSGYFAEPVYQDTSNVWHNIENANRVWFKVSGGRLKVSRALELSNSSPTVGEVVRATFVVENIGDRTMTLQRLVTAVRGPDCTGWACARKADFRQEGPITIEPGEKHRYPYNEYRTFSEAGGGYFAEPVYLDTNNVWRGIEGANRVQFAVGGPGRLKVIGPLSLSTTNPQVGQEVRATFTIKNVGGQAMTVQRMVVAVRGPDCTDWSCARRVDFPTVHSITLPKDGEFSYTTARAFSEAGGGYFAEPVYLDTNNVWQTIEGANRVQFAVSAAGRLQVTGALILSTTNPQVGQAVRANFTVKNVGGQPITLRSLLAAGRGPNCTGWECDNYADFPAVGPITLAAGDQYAYSQVRTFTQAGSGYFVEPVYQDTNNRWKGIPGANRVQFTVARPESSNLALGRTTGATSYNPPYICGNAVDGDLSTRWASVATTEPQQWWVDLGSPKVFNQVVIRWERAYAANYRLLVCDEGDCYLVGDYLGHEGVATHQFPDVELRYVAIYMYGLAPNLGNYSFWEVEVYNTQDASCDSPTYQAENGAIEAPMERFYDSSAEGGYYVGAPRSAGPNHGSVTLQVTVPCPGNYQILGHVQGEDMNTDSFYVSVDGGSEVTWGFKGRDRGVWFWEAVSPGIDTPAPASQFTLSQGSHSVRIRVREAGARLDAVRLVAAGS